MEPLLSEIEILQKILILAVGSDLLYTKSNVIRYFFDLARSAFGQIIVRWVFTYMSFIVPVKRLRETDHWIAFHHPQPAYSYPILLV